MIRAFDAFSLPLLRWFDPEDAHRMAIHGLRLLPPSKPRTDDPKLAVRAFGLNFPNPIGMAAGFDKSAEAPDALLRLGFGFVEIGTVTPKPQAGNPRPRLFRLERDEAVINRMGFNNDGAEAALRRLAARAHLGGIVGVNVGANKDSPDRVADYVKLIETFSPVASYFTVNVSSPNTPGLRNLQQSAALDDLLAKVIDARERVRKNAGDSPVLLKVAPDLSLNELDDVVHIARSRRVDGMIVANTTLARPSTLRETNRAKEQGGLSGRRQPDPVVLVAGLQGPRPGRGYQERPGFDFAPHGPRFPVRNRRRRCRDDHGRGLAGEVAWLPRPLAGIGRSAQHSGRGGVSAYSSLSSLLRRPLTPTLSPQEWGEGARSGSRGKRLPQQRRIPHRLQPAAGGVVRQ